MNNVFTQQELVKYLYNETNEMENMLIHEALTFDVELREELFYEMRELPSGIALAEIARYKNDTRATNKENTCLFHTIYPGPFSTDEQEIEKVYWQNRHETWRDMISNPDKYTTSFINAIREFGTSKNNL